MEEGEVVVGLLFPTDEKSAEAVDPGVSSFDNPAAGTIAWLAFSFDFLLAARLDVWDVVPTFQKSASGG